MSIFLTLAYRVFRPFRSDNTITEHLKEMYETLENSERNIIDREKPPGKPGGFRAEWTCLG